jgi:hypothetical protein
MMFFSFASFVLASVLVSTSSAAITRPEQVHELFGGIQSTIFAYQSSVQDQIRTFRRINGERAVEYYNETLEIIDSSIKNISSSDIEIRSTLTEQPQNPCVTNLVNYVDNIIEQSGYAISNCINIGGENTLNSSSEFTALLDAFERDVNFLQQIAVTSLVGRNVFTQGSEIVERIQAQLDSKTAEFTERLTALTEAARKIATSAPNDFETLKVCFREVDASVANGLSTVEAQVPVCARFGGRGARSSLPDPVTFFPQL